jgi:DNA processing protein
MSEILPFVIARIPGISPAERVKLHNTLCDELDWEVDILLLSYEMIEEILERPLNLKKYPFNIQDVLKEAGEDFKKTERLGLKTVAIDESDYPPLLREIADPPVLLWYRGSLPDPERPALAVVGTRMPTGPCSHWALGLGKTLAAEGVPVVSGLALGIDAMAHRGTVEGRGCGLAILGSAVDYVYPASNRPLARRLLDAGGGILSEYPPGTAPSKWRFPARNRLIAGITRGTVVVEAPTGSGALITAQMALDSNRDLWVAEPGLASPRGEGCRKLQEEGALVCTGAEDILREWKD